MTLVVEFNRQLAKKGRRRMRENTINREVGEQAKGFRLQKLRAIQLLLEEMKKSDTVFVYASTEYIEDVFVYAVENDDSRTYLESDKDYDSRKSFTFMSEEVWNSLVSFLDCWISQDFSPSVVFGFYTNITIGKEKNTEYTKSRSIVLPDQSIIELLKQRKYDYPNLLHTVRDVLIDRYKQQYEDKDINGYVTTIEKFEDEEWIGFLDKIHWKFDMEDDIELEDKLLNDIRELNMYGLSLESREKYVLYALEGMLDKKQRLSDKLARLMTGAEVRATFLEVANNHFKRNDPVYAEWEAMDPPDDNRNLAEKILSVSSEYNPNKLKYLARKVGAVRREYSLIDNKEKAAYLYRIYDLCTGMLFEFIEKHQGQDLTPKVIDYWIEEMTDCAEKHLADLSQDYSYPFKNRDTLKNAVLELLDSCFLAFDLGDEDAS